MYKIPKQCPSSLANLIINTNSIDEVEKQYWFDIIPDMTRQQIWRLHEILDHERIELEKLLLLIY